MVTMKTDSGSYTFYGLSTDTKPTNIEQVAGISHDIPNGSCFYEMDTVKLYMWDAANKIWRLQ